MDQDGKISDESVKETDKLDEQVSKIVTECDLNNDGLILCI